MATVTIPDATFRKLQEAASIMRLPLDKFLDQVASENAAALATGQPIASPGTVEWTRRFEAWVASHPARDRIADDSRDTIYGDERI
jgi:hypothetical protein